MSSRFIAVYIDIPGDESIMGYFSTPHYRQMPGHSVRAGTSANCVPLTAGHWPWTSASSLHKVSGLSAKQNKLILPLRSFCSGTDSSFPCICPQYTTQSTSDILRASQCPTLLEQPHSKFNLSSTLSRRIRREEAYPAHFTSPRPWGGSQCFPVEEQCSQSYPHLCKKHSFKHSHISLK